MAGDQTVGGGGRYDGLTRALGSDVDVPSLGFAFNVDALAALTPAVDSRPDGVLVAPAGPNAAAAAARHAAEVRQGGETAVLSFDSPIDVPALLKQADSAGCSRILIVDEDGRTSVRRTCRESSTRPAVRGSVVRGRGAVHGQLRSASVAGQFTALHGYGSCVAGPRGVVPTAVRHNVRDRR